MRKLASISSPYWNGPSFQLVFEWERILSKALNLPIYKQSKLMDWIYRQIDLRLKMTNIFNFFVPFRNFQLIFVMQATAWQFSRLTKNIIPIIIDFWIEDKNELRKFYNSYNRVPLVLVTSAEVYKYLKNNSCPLNIAHLALSLPDQYLPDIITDFKKIYDFCFIGRPNPFFRCLIEKYTEENPEFEYIVNQGEISNREYYTNSGKFVMKDNGRDSYLKIIQSSKITCYSTPGLDEGKEFKTSFNQVTPRLFEMIAGGCYVLGQYPKNEDVEFYELEKYVPNVNSYDQFKFWMDKYRLMPKRNIIECRDFLLKNCTSERIETLKTILFENNIIIKN